MFQQGWTPCAADILLRQRVLFLFVRHRSSRYYGQTETEGGDLRLNGVPNSKPRGRVNLIVQWDSTKQRGSTTKAIDPKANPSEAVHLVVVRKRFYSSCGDDGQFTSKC